jgi:hypothetical protein
VREQGLCRRHSQEWKRSGLTLDAFLKQFLPPGKGTPIPGFDPAVFRCFPDGSIWSRAKNAKRWKRLKVSLNNGASHVLLPGPNGPSRRYRVASLVLSAFGDPRPIGYEPMHYPDPGPMNNALENLRWVPRGTSKLGRDPLPGRHPDQRGSRNPIGKLTEEVIPVIRSRYRSGSPIADIAAEMGVCDGTIRLVLKGKTWSHVPDPEGPVVLRSDRPRGTDVAWSKLDELDVDEIRSRRAAGETIASLATAFGVTLATIHAIVSGRTWAHVLKAKED